MITNPNLGSAHLLELPAARYRRERYKGDEAATFWFFPEIDCEPCRYWILPRATFPAQRGSGDAIAGMENETFLAKTASEFDIMFVISSILAEAAGLRVVRAAAPALLQ